VLNYIEMTNIERTYERILRKFDRVVTVMESMHAPSLSFGTGVAMFRREIHTVQAIGRNPGINVTDLAEYMGVTKGAVSQTITKLTKKGLVRKTYAPGNAKEVILELTDLGQIGFQNHEKFHMEALNIARDYFGDQFESKFEAIEAVMDDLTAIVEESDKRLKSK
jgi:DNA-binding MarR family transcriptional regulator